MDWRSIIRAVDGEPAALNWLAQKGWARAAAECAALLLLDDAPHSEAALVIAGCAGPRAYGRPVAAALAPHAARALAEWRADPDRAKRCIRSEYPDDLIDGIAHLIAALRDDPAALRDATVVVTRDGNADAIASCLANLGAAGWERLNDAERRALWTRAWQDRPAAIGCVWSALTAAQQAATVSRIEERTGESAALIGGIGAAAWQMTDAALRRRMIDAAAREPPFVPRSAPAWTGMSDAERDRLVTAVVAFDNSWVSYSLLDELGHDGRMIAPADRRAALDGQAAHTDACRPALLRLADAGWDALSDAERQTLMARAETDPSRFADFIRAAGIAGWRALPPDVQKRLRAAAPRDPSALLACPPALWGDLSGGRSLPPSTSVASWAIEKWREEDADADLSALPPSHQTTVLALAPWRGADCDPSAARMARLLVAWNGMTADARVDLATALPWTLEVVAAVARRRACAATTATIVDALTVMERRDAPDAAARETVGRMLAARRRWRTWMRAFVPTDDDPPEAWDAWRRAARRGAIPDRSVVLRLMADAARRPPRWMRR